MRGNHLSNAHLHKTEECVAYAADAGGSNTNEPSINGQLIRVDFVVVVEEWRENRAHDNTFDRRTFHIVVVP